MSTAAQLVTSVLDAFTTLSPFEYDTYQQELTAAFGLTVDQFTSQASTTIFSDDPYGTPGVAQNFKVQSIALGVSRTTLWNFSQFANTSTALSDLQSTSNSLVVPVYRLHLDAQLAQQNVNQTISQLCSNPDFCTAFVQHVLEPTFINDSLIALYLGGNAHFTQAVAFLYENARPLLMTLSTNSTFQNSLTDSSQPVSIIAKQHLTEIDVFASTVSNNSQLSQANETTAFNTHNLPITWSDNVNLQGPAFDSLGTAWASAWASSNIPDQLVTNLINVQTKHEYTITTHGGEEPIFAYHLFNGEALYDWMVEQQNGGYSQLFSCSGGNPSERPSGGGGGGGGCFSPETKITTSAGDITIGELQPYSKVLTQAPNQWGKTSDEKVEHSTTFDQVANCSWVIPLFGFNGEKPFVTAGHIFFTPAGPKAIAPSLARAENDDIHVGRLKVGDVLLRLKKDCSGYDRIRIDSIGSDMAQPSTVCGVHFGINASGGNGYHANGYWVVANYPQLTIKGIQKRYESIGVQNRLSFTKHIKALPAVFRKVLGPVVNDTVKKSFGDARAPNTALDGKRQDSPIAKFEHAARNRRSIKALSNHFVLIESKTIAASTTKSPTGGVISSQVLSENGTSYSKLVLQDGAVAVDGRLVDHASMSQHSVQWSRKLSSSKNLYQHCALRTLNGGNLLLGYTAQGPPEVSALQELTAVTPVMAILDANTYVVQGSGTNFTTGVDAMKARYSDKSNDWQTFWKIEIGLVDDQGTMRPAIRFPEVDALYDKAFGPGQGRLYANTPPASVVGTTMLFNVEVVTGIGYFWSTIVPSGDTHPPFFRTVTVTVDIATGLMQGYYCEYVANQATGPIHALVSTSSTAASTEASMNLNAQIQQARGSDIKDIGTDLYSPTANIHPPALPSTSVLAAELFTDSNLSNQALALIAAPSSSDLNQQTQVYFQNAANYWRLTAEVDTFGNDQSAMSSKLPSNGSLTTGVELADQEWLGKYDRTLIMQSLSGDATYSNRFSKANQDQVTYYFQGGQKGCLSVDPQYNKISDICAAQAFRILTGTELDPYLSDTKDWALSFYNWCVTDTQLNELVWNYTISAGANSLVNTYCMIINALDTQGRQLDHKLWKMVLDKVIMALSSGTVTGDDSTPAFLQLIMAQLITAAQTDSSTALNQSLQINLQAMEEAFGVSSAEELAAQVFSNTTPLGITFISVMADLKNVYCKWRQMNLSDIMKLWKQKLLAKYPQQGARLFQGLQYSMAFVTLAFDGLALYASIKTLLDWSNLSDAQRAQAVIGLVKTVLVTARDCVSLLQLMVGQDPTQPMFSMYTYRYSKLIGAEGGNNASTEDEDFADDERQPILDRDTIASVDATSDNDTLAAQVGTTTQDPELPGDMAKEFSVSDAAVGVISIAANVAAAIVMGFQIKNDFATDQPVGVDVMDIMSEVVSSLQVITGVIEIAAMLIGFECIAIPIVGVVIAIAGIVLMFCEMFIHHDPGENPVDKYLDNNLSTFIDALPTRPATTLTYALASSTVSCGQQGASITVQITNPANSTLQFRSWIISFYAGDAADQLFAIPATGSPATYAVTVGQSTFQIAGASVANPEDNSMTAKVTPVGMPSVQAAPLPDGGVTFTITGNINSSKGTSKIKITECAENRGTQIPNSDYYVHLSVTKQ